MRAPKYGDTVETVVCLGDDEWTVRGQFDPSGDGVNVEEMTGPGGRVITNFGFDKLPIAYRDRVEQAVIDCYAHPIDEVA